MSHTNEPKDQSSKSTGGKTLNVPKAGSAEAQERLKHLRKHHAEVIAREQAARESQAKNAPTSRTDNAHETKANTWSGNLAEPSQAYNPCFPEGLREAERLLFEQRRVKAGLPDPKAPRIGLALSGGGIRSATFCLGVLQGLAGCGLLRRVDFLSTVSGGGYAGSFLGRMFTRDWVAKDEPIKPKDMESWPAAVDAAVKLKGEGSSVRRVEAVLDDHQSAPLQWLRESGRYLLPAGAGDGLMAGAVALRNWAAVMVVIVMALLTGFLLCDTVRAGLWQGCDAWKNGVEIPLLMATDKHWWWSPLLILPGMALIFFALPLGMAYWLTQKDRNACLEIPLWTAVAAVLLLAGIGMIFLQSSHPTLGPLAFTAVVVFSFTLWYYALARAATNRKAGGQRTAADGEGANVGEGSWPFAALLGALLLLVSLAVVWLYPAFCSRITAGIVALAGFAALCEAAAGREENHFGIMRNQLSRWFTTALTVTLMLLILAVVDSLGQMAYALLRPENRPGMKEFLGVTGILALFGVAPRLKLLLDQLPDRKVAQIPVSLVAAIGSVLLAGTLLIAVSGVAHGFAWQWKNPGATVMLTVTNLTAANGTANVVTAMSSNIIPVVRLSGQLHETSRVKLNEANLIQVVDEADVAPSAPAKDMSVKWAGAALAGCLILTFVFGRTLTFINLSSYQTLYGARICRAYQGASNPQRWYGAGQRMGETLPSDDIPWRDYAPHENGGPLHIVNVTLNETVGGKSQVESQDRQGLLVALGPAGITIGARFHALWAADVPTDSLRVDFASPLPACNTAGTKSAMAAAPPDATMTAKDRLVNAPAASALKFGYHPLYGAKEDRQTGRPLQMVERLSLQQWVGISGAAFTTGLGKGTSVAKSVMLGLANIRLGYWWDSFIEPAMRKKTSLDYVPGNWLKEKVAWMFPVQAHLADEFFAKFRGPNSRLWYLSDGGHFENTGAYELVRRRVPCILLCDCGCDPGYVFEDLAQLVRMVRVDFAAEIDLLTALELAGLDLGPARNAFGEPEDFAAREAEAASPDQQAKPRRLRPHALLGRVWYPGENNEPRQGGFSWLIVFKPGLSGDEPLDVKHYHSAYPDFPQETTLDQFFDEAQWESYRKLGRHIAEQLTPWLAKFTAPPEA